MTKRDIIEALKEFSDDETITLGESDGGLIKYSYQLKPAVVCGGQRALIPYFCVRERSHTGLCYCECKNVSFEMETFDQEYLAEFYEEHSKH